MIITMRAARILEEPSAEANSYHSMSHAIEGRFVFDEVAKEGFRDLFKAHAETAGIRVDTWCCMSNHFHGLMEVPNAQANRARLEDEEILRRLSLVMKGERLFETRRTLE